MKPTPSTPEREQAANWRVYQTLTDGGKVAWIKEYCESILREKKWKRYNVSEEQVKECHHALVDNLYSWLKRRYGIEPVFSIVVKYTSPLIFAEEILFEIKSEQLEVDFILRQPLYFPR